MRWKDHHESWVGNDLEGDDRGVFQCTVAILVWRGWGKPRNAFSVAINVAEIRIRYLSNVEMCLVLLVTKSKFIFAVQCMWYMSHTHFLSKVIGGRPVSSRTLVTTAWQLLRVRIEKTASSYANMLNKNSRTADKVWSSSLWGGGGGGGGGPEG
jgi:hypothetical protein